MVMIFFLMEADNSTLDQGKLLLLSVFLSPFYLPFHLLSTSPPLHLLFLSLEYLE